MPVSYYFVGAGLQFALVLGIRFSYRMVLLERSRRGRGKATERPGSSRVMLIGAGSAGQMILRDMHNSPSLNQKVCCIIDDNPNKWNRYIDGVPIVGGRDDIISNVEKYQIDKIYLAIPSADAATRRDILDICKETGCEMKNLPGMYQFVLGEVKVAAMKDVAVEDLLGRDPVNVDLKEILSFLKGKVVLVTGGGGSIGSELCRQIAGHDPKLLIIFDIYENNAYAIQQELKEKYPDLNLEVLIGSVRDSRKVNQLFAQYHPDVVYHAAAHKHVPLMEDSPCESIKNNVVGTYKVAYAAMHSGCQRFVLISTDKAVNPTNIMGASKRLCEMVIQLFDQMIKAGRAAQIPALSLHEEGESLPMIGEANTEFVAVRFGNVLGSNGSVIPLFKKQIAKGGPVTVTHPDIIRYFMTIPEAVSLVLEAGTYANGGEIFILDMGAPVKIDTLARNLIKLSGLKPDVDIMIKYTGLRPGEKLYEEKLMAEEGMRTTPNHLIHIAQPMSYDEYTLLGQLEMLMEAAYDGREDIRDLVEQVVPTYHPAENSVKERRETNSVAECLAQTL
jgi:FlaA1/EpsC-like NDP-sugar epimerase